ncbi:response regulator transcription factor [Iodobacter sp. HSC-16F04]|uniref:Response regulator transcription factor n=1 Tax=Iodobacter violaceini TaxID=3044271 RepID=A0ABX0KRC0_9NEIS|nr:response regulator transcription factor [Iodobacter violacea]NHQ87185.1 response regulator transcription factor [Iodobacter violacea]
MNYSILTADPFLFAHVQQATQQELIRLDSLAALAGRSEGVVLIDLALAALPALNDPAWLSYTSEHQIIFVSSAPGDAEHLAALTAGARGYCHAYAASESLLAVINVVAAGGVWAGPAILQALIRSMNKLFAPKDTDAWMAPLTAREREVAILASNGSVNKDIARELGITERTVKFHLGLIFEKLKVSDRLQLALLAKGIR